MTGKNAELPPAKVLEKIDERHRKYRELRGLYGRFYAQSLWMFFMRKQSVALALQHLGELTQFLHPPEMRWWIGIELHSKWLMSEESLVLQKLAAALHPTSTYCHCLAGSTTLQRLQNSP